MSGSGEPPYQRRQNGGSRSSSLNGTGKPDVRANGKPPKRSRPARRGFWQSLFGVGRSRSTTSSASHSSGRVAGAYPQLPPIKQPQTLQPLPSASSQMRHQPSHRANGASNGHGLMAKPSAQGGARALPPRRLKPQPSNSLAVANQPEYSLSASPRSTRDRALPPQPGNTTAQRRRRPSTPPSRRRSAAVYATRILILSLGVGVLAGTLLSAWDPTGKTVNASRQSPKQASVKPDKAGEAEPQTILLGSEITALKAPLQTVMAKDPKLKAGTFFLDMDTNAYIDVNGATPFSAASTIKFPILVAFFQDVDAGKIRLDEPLTMTKELIAKESGDMQFQPPGTKFSALETVTKMIEISDNTATNMLIARLGGMSALNQRFRSWGLTITTINNVLPDLEGTNQTTPKELSLLLARIGRGDLVSVKSRDRMMAIMQKTVTDSMLPRGLEAGATISHKTGDIGTTVGDVGLIDLPNGKRYVGTVFVNRPRNDDRGPDLVRQISRLTYQNFAKSSPAPAVTPAPAATSPAEPL